MDPAPVKVEILLKRKECQNMWIDQVVQKASSFDQVRYKGNPKDPDPVALFFFRATGRSTAYSYLKNTSLGEL